jgi:hypothetical protein
MKAVSRLACLAVVAAAIVFGCKRSNSKAIAPKPTTSPATTRRSVLSPEPPRPVASPQAIARFADSARPFIGRLIATTQSLAGGLTLAAYRVQLNQVNAALPAVVDPPPESIPCYNVMSLIRDAVINLQEAEQHWAKTIADPEKFQKMTPEQRAAFAQQAPREAGYRDNCFQAAARATTQASDQLDAIAPKRS